MAATFNLAQTIGAAPGLRRDLGSCGEIVSFKAEDTFGVPSTAITPGTFSYELWLQCHYTNIKTSVQDIIVWGAYPVNQGSPWDDVTLRFGLASTYRTPINTASDIAIHPLPNSDRGQRNVTIQGDVSGVIIGHGYSDFIVLQIEVTNALAAPQTLMPLRLMFTEIEQAGAYIP